MTVTNRDRIYKLFQGKTPDRVPWFGDLDYWYHAASQNGRLPEKYVGDGYFTLNRDLCVGFYLQGFYPYLGKNEGCIISEQTDGNRLVRLMSTPKGNLTEIFHYLPVSSSWGHVKFFVETGADLPAFQYYLENLEFFPAYEEAMRRKELIGDNGVVLCYTPRSPFMEMVTSFIGIMNLSYLLIDMPEEMDEIFDIMERKFDLAAQIAIESPAECIMIPENLSSEVVGRNYYLKYMRGYEQKWIKKTREAGKVSFIHMDGTLRGLAKYVAETGFDVIEAMTPQPSGDMTMEQISHEVKGKSILWGGLPGAIFTPSFSELEFVNHVRYVLDIMKREPRFVLGVADQVPPDGLLERVGMVAELCDLYGCY